MQKNARRENAPNYGPAKVQGQSCRNCAHYGEYPNDSGYCRQFNFTVKQDYSCDAWMPPAKLGTASSFFDELDKILRARFHGES